MIDSAKEHMIIFLDYWTSQQINNSNGGLNMNYADGADKEYK